MQNFNLTVPHVDKSFDTTQAIF